MKNRRSNANIIPMESSQLLKEIKIIFENEDFFALNKPVGLLTHSAKINSKEPTLVDWLLERYPQIKNVGEDETRPGIVHRLDRETSGLMIVAKNQKSFEYLKNLFQERKIKKGYLTLVFGTFKNKTGTINKPIGIKSSSIKRSTAARKMREMKEAETDYKVIRNFKSDKGPGFAFLEVFPKTGRTNQIRVHLASIGHPVVGDKVYGSKKLTLPCGLNRMFLHAYLLEFPLKEGKVLRLEADLPEDLKEAAQHLGLDSGVNI